MKFFANAYTKSGIPDLLVCCNGHFVAVEVKAPNGRPSELQKWNIQQINQQDGYGVILYPDQFDEFKRLIAYLKSSCTLSAYSTVLKINERWDK